MRKVLQRAEHFSERVKKETKRFPHMLRSFGADVALHGFVDGLFPPGKSPAYIHAVEKYVDREMEELVSRYQDISRLPAPDVVRMDKVPVWCCWWQGEEQMPELVRMCHERLKQVIPPDVAELHLITLDNYRDYVSFPEHIDEKFRRGVITMTTMSDVLRFQLLGKYGGYWLDATLFFTDEIPEAYFSGRFFCQRMASDPEKVRREACKGNWCGFSMAGPAGSPVFRYMNDAFSEWWSRHDDIVDYVLIDYLLWTGYRKIPAIREIIDSVPDNNEDIFELYQVLNQPYSWELYERMTRINVMHKLTYKMETVKKTEAGEPTMYGYLWDRVFVQRDPACDERGAE